MARNEEGLALPVHFRNKQWAVTAYGIECLKGFYEIEKSRFGEDSGGYPDWPLHMAEKDWVDVALFMEAFMIGLWVHRGAYSLTPFLTADWMDKVSKRVARFQRDRKTFPRFRIVNWSDIKLDLMKQ